MIDDTDLPCMATKTMPRTLPASGARKPRNMYTAVQVKQMERGGRAKGGRGR